MYSFLSCVAFESLTGGNLPGGCRKIRQIRRARACRPRFKEGSKGLQITGSRAEERQRSKIFRQIPVRVFKVGVTLSSRKPMWASECGPCDKPRRLLSLCMYTCIALPASWKEGTRLYERQEGAVNVRKRRGCNVSRRFIAFHC